MTEAKQWAAGWIRMGAVLLPFMAGAVNATALLGFVHAGVSYMTGAVANGALLLARGDLAAAASLALLVLSFLLGAILAGAIVGSVKLNFGRRYGVALILEGVLLVLSTLLFERGAIGGEFLAAMACGLQNAMVATYSGAVIRSTHVTGILSDIGSLLGNLLLSRTIDSAHLLLLTTILVSFSTGAWAGSLLFFAFSYRALLFPALSLIGVGLAYAVLRHRRAF